MATGQIFANINLPSFANLPDTLDASMVRRVLQAIHVAQHEINALYNGPHIFGRTVDDAICIVSDHLEEASCALESAVHRDYDDAKFEGRVV